MTDNRVVYIDKKRDHRNGPSSNQTLKLNSCLILLDGLHNLSLHLSPYNGLLHHLNLLLALDILPNLCSLLNAGHAIWPVIYKATIPYS